MAGLLQGVGPCLICGELPAETELVKSISSQLRKKNISGYLPGAEEIFDLGK